MKREPLAFRLWELLRARANERGRIVIDDPWIAAFELGSTPKAVMLARKQLGAAGGLLLSDDACPYDVVCGEPDAVRAALRAPHRARAMSNFTYRTRLTESRLYFVVLGSAANDGRAVKELPSRPRRA